MSTVFNTDRQLQAPLLHVHSDLGPGIDSLELASIIDNLVGFIQFYAGVAVTSRVIDELEAALAPNRELTIAQLESVLDRWDVHIDDVNSLGREVYEAAFSGGASTRVVLSRALTSSASVVEEFGRSPEAQSTVRELEYRNPLELILELAPWVAAGIGGLVWAVKQYQEARKRHWETEEVKERVRAARLDRETKSADHRRNAAFVSALPKGDHPAPQQAISVAISAAVVSVELRSEGIGAEVVSELSRQLEALPAALKVVLSTKPGDTPDR